MKQCQICRTVQQQTYYLRETLHGMTKSKHKMQHFRISQCVRSLCLTIRKVVIGWIRNQNQKLRNILKLSDTRSMVELKNKRIENKIFCDTTLIRWKWLTLKKKIKLQKQHDQKEHLIRSLQDIGGLLKSLSEVEIICWSKVKEFDVKQILKNQIFFCKHNLVKIFI